MTESTWNERARSIVSAASRVRGDVSFSVVSAGAVIERGARVEHAVVLDGAVIEPGARVTGAIVGSRARVKRGVVLGGESGEATWCSKGRIYRTLAGVAVVPSEEVIARAARTERPSVLVKGANLGIGA